MWQGNHIPDDTTDRWSAPFGAWLGVPVRLHVSLVLMLAVIAWGVFQSGSFALGLAAVVYLISVVGHELSHVFAAKHVDGEVEGLVLGPSGGVRPPLLPEDPEARLFVAMAGPVFHLLMLVLGAICLSTNGDPLLSTLWPSGNLDSLTEDTPAILLAKLIIWVNGPLFLFSMLPTFPFDGGEALRSLLWPWFGRATANQIVYRFAFLISITLLIAASMVVTPVTPWAWPGVGLVALSVLVMFGAHRDNQAHTESNWIRGPHRIGDSGERSLDEWKDSDERMVLVELKAQAKNRDAEEFEPSDIDEATEDRQVDDILAKLHTEGLERLSYQERQILERASKRYRRRDSN